MEGIEEHLSNIRRTVRGCFEHPIATSFREGKSGPALAPDAAGYALSFRIQASPPAGSRKPHLSGHGRARCQLQVTLDAARMST
jgi:hypothetical protein